MRAFQAAFRRVTLRRQDIHLLAFRRQHRRGVGQLRTGLIDARTRLLRILHRARTDSGEVGVAVQFMFGESRFSLGRYHFRLRLSDQRCLTIESGPSVLQLCLRNQRFGSGGFGGSAQIAVIDQGQQLPRLDLLIVFHQHLFDEPGNPRHYQGVVRRDVRVIGALLRALAKQIGRQQIKQHAQRDHDGSAHGHFLL
ncbi:hypothetical protein D3C71_1126760 [compost metagenome]